MSQELHDKFVQGLAECVSTEDHTFATQSAWPENNVSQPQARKGSPKLWLGCTFRKSALEANLMKDVGRAERPFWRFQCSIYSSLHPGAKSACQSPKPLYSDKLLTVCLPLIKTHTYRLLHIALQQVYHEQNVSRRTAQWNEA
jgi:hypothetical protein